MDKYAKITIKSSILMCLFLFIFLIIQVNAGEELLIDDKSPKDTFIKIPPSTLTNGEEIFIKGYKLINSSGLIILSPSETKCTWYSPDSLKKDLKFCEIEFQIENTKSSLKGFNGINLVSKKLDGINKTITFSTIYEDVNNTIIINETNNDTETYSTRSFNNYQSIKAIDLSKDKIISFKVSFDIPKYLSTDFNISFSGDDLGTYILDPTVSSCGNLNSSGTYTLTQSVNSSAGCFTISAHNIELDCAGYDINYSETTNGYGIYDQLGYDNVTIRNCNLNTIGTTASNSYAIYLTGTTDRSNILNNNISTLLGTGNNNHGVLITGGTYHNITNNSIKVGNAYSIYSTANSIFISTNNVSTNGLNTRALFISGGTGIIIYKNNIYAKGTNNANRGIVISNSANITGNIINTYGTDTNKGIDISAGDSYTIQSNIISTNGTSHNNHGISLSLSSKNNILENNISTNGTSDNYGIYLFSNSDENIISNNLILTNGTTSDSIYLSASGSNFPDNNNITNNILSTSEWYNINIASGGINGTYLINQPIKNYTFSGNGGIFFFKNETWGEIKYLININGTGTNLSNDLRIENNSVTIESTINNGLNRSANVTLYNIPTTFSNPSILRDGVACNSATSPPCTNFTSLNAGTVVFNVSSWSNYSIGEIILPSGAGYTACGEINVSGVYTLNQSITSTGTCLNVTTDNVMLDINGFNITYGTGGVAGYGVYIRGYDNLTLKNAKNISEGNTSGSNKHAVYLINSNKSTIQNNTITTVASGNGIYLTSSSNSTIQNNTISTLATGPSGHGFYIISSSNFNDFTSNIISAANGYGFYLASSSNSNSLTSNNISTNGFGGMGIYIDSSSNSTFQNNTISTIGNEASGFYLTSPSKSNIFTSNTISTTGSDAYGLYVYSSSNSTFTSNILNVSNSDRISLATSSSDNNFINNSITNRNYSYYDIRFANGGINGTILTDQYIANYSFTGKGGTITIKNSQWGEVKYLGNVNGTGENMSNMINIQNNSINVTSTSAFEFNSSANVTLYNIPTTFSNPSILRDGVVCNNATNPPCTNFTSLNAGTVIFNVSSWSNYSIGEIVIFPQINFTDPTPANATQTSNTSIQINVSITQMTNPISEVNYNWNGTNYTMYNDSLVLMMNFDNVSALGENASDVKDLSKWGNNGSVVGAVVNTTGKYGGAYTFDGSDDWINVSDSSSLEFGSNNFAISFWAYPITGDTESTIISKSTSGSLGPYVIKYGTDVNWRFLSSETGSSWAINYPFVMVQYDSWKQVLVNRNGNNFSFYIDGVIVNSTTSSHSLVNNAEDFRIGSLNYGPDNQFFQGEIDEVRVWNRSLNADEVYEQYVSNLNKFNSTQWYLYVNQSKNASDGLSLGNYTYFSSAKDTSGNENITGVRNIEIIVAGDTLKPYFTNIPTNQSLELNITKLDVDFNASDDISFDSFAINWTTNFQINKSGTLINSTTLVEGTYILNITINDSTNNINSTIYQVFVNDTLKPYFVDISNGTFYQNQSVGLDINASDLGTGIKDYTLNWTTLFSINSTGFITNISNLNLGSYYLNVSINDTKNNLNSTIINITMLQVVDTLKPYFTNIPTNQTLELNVTKLDVDFNASDDISFDSFAINWTTLFTINKSGTLINSTTLTEGTYILNITINDSTNNINSTIYQVFVNDTLKPYFTTIPSNLTLELNLSLAFAHFIGNDFGVGLKNYSINDTSLFVINDTGDIRNITTIINGLYLINISLNDTKNNLNSTIFKILVNDTTPPYFNPLPTNESMYQNESAFIDVNAFDFGVGLKNYSINDTSLFAINDTGDIRNISSLVIGTYKLNVTANDTLNNLNSTIVQIVVSAVVDTLNPYFTSGTPINLTAYDNQTISQQINASDDFGISCFAVNNSNFNMNCSGWFNNNSFISAGFYLINVTINDTSNNINSSIFSINVSNSTIIDTTYPTFSLFNETLANGSIYTFQNNYMFNVSLLNTNGSVGLEFNGTNRTVQNISEVFNSSVYDLGVGTYAYYWWAYGNGTNNLYNVSGTRYYTITKASPLGSMTLSSTSISYPNQTTATGTENNNGDGGVVYSLWRNNISVSNPETTILGVGTWYYLYNATGGQNYTDNSSISYQTLTITQNNTYVLNLAGTSPISYGVAGDFAGTLCPSEITSNCNLYRNGTSVSNPDTTILGVGSYSYQFNSTGNTNYSATNTSVQTLTINKIASVVNLSLNKTASNISITNGSTIDLNCSSITGDSSATLTLFNNETSINSGVSPLYNLTSFSGVGIYNITCIYSSSQNHTSSSQIWWIDVTPDISPPYFTGIPTNQTLELNITKLDVDFNASDELSFDSFAINWTSDFSINKSGTLINSTTLVEGTYIINVTINDTTNNINSTIYQVFINDTLKPYFTTIPANATLEFGVTSLGVDFNAVDLGTGIKNWTTNDLTNFTINSSGMLSNKTNLAIGNYYINVSINDSKDNLNSTTYWVNVSDTISPNVTFNTPINNTITNNQTVNFTANITDSGGIQNATLYIYNNSGLYNQTTTNVGAGITSTLVGIQVYLVEGIYTWFWKAYDLVMNLGSSETNEVNRTITIDITASNFTIVFPLNNSNYTINNLDINYSVVESNLDSCWYTNDSGKNNQTITSCANLTTPIWLEGTNNITIYVNDTANNVNSSSVSFFVDTIKPEITITSPINNTNFNNLIVEINYTFTEANPNNCWYTNNSGTSNNSITCGTNLTTLTWLQGINNITLWLNDTSGNMNFSSVSFNVDTLNPYFTDIPTNQSLELNVTKLDVDFNASDDISFDSFAINWTSSFTINKSGTLINSTTLTEGTYILNITINDSSNNINSTIYQVFVNDTLKPFFNQISNTSVNYTNLVYIDINASDLGTGIKNYSINSTIFSIGNTGVIINLTQIGVGSYYLNISINDSKNNLNSTIINITITKTSSLIYMYLDSLRANKSIDNQTEVNLTAVLVTGESNIQFYVNESIYHRAISPISNITNLTMPFNYNITSIYLSSQNYTQSSETWWLNVTQYVAPVVPSGGGGGGGGEVFKLNETTCKVVYKFLVDYGKNYSKIEDIKSDLKQNYNRLESYTTIKTYMDNWQGLCSDRINRSLEENYVCEKMFYMLLEKGENYTAIDTSNLIKNITLVSVSPNLLKHYIDNYEERCYDYYKQLPGKEINVIKIAEKLIRDLSLSPFFGESIPLPRIIFNMTDSTALYVKYMFDLEYDNGYVIKGIRIWFVLSILMFISLMIIFVFRKKIMSAIKKKYDN